MRRIRAMQAPSRDALFLGSHFKAIEDKHPETKPAKQISIFGDVLYPVLSSTKPVSTLYRESGASDGRAGDFDRRRGDGGLPPAWERFKAPRFYAI
jgi:hypothetical protein